jgi:hypothetical protein
MIGGLASLRREDVMVPVLPTQQDRLTVSSPSFPIAPRQRRLFLSRKSLGPRTGACGRALGRGSEGRYQRTWFSSRRGAFQRPQAVAPES